MLEVVLAALVGSLPVLLAWRRSQRVSNAEVEELRSRAVAQRANAADKLTDAAMQLVEPLQTRIADLENVSRQQAEGIEGLNRKLERSTRLIQALLRGLAVLTEQIRGLGVTPAFVIPVYDGDVAYLSRVLSDELLREDTW